MSADTPMQTVPISTPSIFPTTIAPPQSSVDLFSSLQVERIIRHRFLGPEQQFRIKWVGLNTETWKTKDQLFWNGEDALNKLNEFETWAKEHPEEALIEKPIEKQTAVSNSATAAAAQRDGGDDVDMFDRSNELDYKSTSKRSTSMKGRVSTAKSGGATKRKRSPIATTSKTAATTSKKTTTNNESKTLAKRSSSRKKKDTKPTIGSGVNFDGIDDELLHEHDIYEVERFIGDVWESGIHWYRVKWKGYSDYDNSWQRPEDLIGCQEQLNEYWKIKRERRAKQMEYEKEERKKSLNERKQKKVEAQLQQGIGMKTAPSAPYAPSAATTKSRPSTFAQSVFNATSTTSALISAASSPSSASGGLFLGVAITDHNNSPLSDVGLVPATSPTTLDPQAQPISATPLSQVDAYNAMVLSSAGASSSSSSSATPSAAAPSAIMTVQMTPAPSDDVEMAEVDEFQIESFPTLQAAQASPDHAENTTRQQHAAAAASIAHAASNPFTLSSAALAAASSAIAAAAAVTETSTPLPSDYEASVHLRDDDAESDSESSTSSSSSFSSYHYLHPQHKHVHDLPQCIISHDYYESAPDESTWLFLIKWKHRPVAECSWEPKDEFGGMYTEQKKILTNYLKSVTDAHVKQCIIKNLKP